MKKASLTSVLLGGASLAALACAPASAQVVAGRYAAGDFHNHTVCSDGSVSQITSLQKALQTFQLDWFVNTDHGGVTSRDCRFDNPSFVVGTAGDAGQLYVDTIARGDYGPTAKFKGDPVKEGNYSGSRGAVASMWRWQNLAEFQYPLQVSTHTTVGASTPIMMGYEQVVPGHEHSETIILNGQYPKRGAGNDIALAEFEFRFDRADTDSTGPLDANGKQIWTGKDNVNNSGTAGHAKSVKGVQFMQANYPTTSYNIPAHLERQGPFNPAGNNGYDINHLRDFNNAGPTVAFGFESEPGHQADANRGSYGTGAVGGGTYGGVGYYAAKVGGVWDALLGEGRNWFFFASSDWHNRGNFSPFVPQSTADWYPGEFQKEYVFFPGGNITKQGIVDGLRSGNSFSVMAELVTGDMTFTATDGVNTATMGQTLVVTPGADVTISMTVNLPTGPNRSPYSFNNPVLASVGISQPLNKPVLDHLDLITGDVTGVIAPTDPNYAGSISSKAVESNPAATNNRTTKIAATFSDGSWTVSGKKRSFTYTIKGVTVPQYVRVRGTNLTAGIPNATDAFGNPVLDFNNNKIPCPTAAGCPAHVNGVVNYDVRGWSTPWMYTNPIFIRPSNVAPLLVETNAALARQLAGN